MEYNVVEFSKCQQFRHLLYEYNRCINSELDDDNLNEWLNKIMTVGDPMGIIVNEKIIAFLLLYCNNKENLAAYICNVHVDKRYRGKRLSVNLIDRAIQICRDRKFKCINLDVAESNIPALKIYRSCGFIESERYFKGSECNIRMTYYI